MDISGTCTDEEEIGDGGLFAHIENLDIISLLRESQFGNFVCQLFRRSRFGWALLLRQGQGCLERNFLSGSIFL